MSMKKIITHLSNIFQSNNNAGTFVTDAVPVDDPPDNGNSSNLYSNNQSISSGDFNAALQLQNQMAESAELAMVRANSNGEVGESSTGSAQTITNNQMAVQNTQQHVELHFSHINGFHMGPVININSDELAKPVTESILGGLRHPRSNRPRRTTTIESMMRSSEELNHRMLDTISTHLGEGWRNVLRDLGLSQGQIDQTVIDHQIHGGIKEVIYQLLLGWTRNAEDGEATLGIITSLLWKSDHRECVQKMKETYKYTAPTE